MTLDLLGSIALWAALLLAIVAVVTGRRTFLSGASVAAGIAAALLTVGLLGGDFSLAYVVKTTSLSTPWPYRIAALWGGMEGSMLFYTLLTMSVSAVALHRNTSIRVASLVGAGLVLLTIGFANPFATLEVPAVDGQGLLAILQHPAMIYHPPILYLGLSVLIVPFAKTVDMALHGYSRREWRIDVRRWMYVSWTFLTLGMAAGANWAYVELGWGGFWAWDPVENTALMPWLAATVFLHSSRIEQAQGSLTRWNLLMAGVPFALTVVGIYLTRSGVTGSIHSFAEDPVVGGVLLISTAVVIITLVILALRSEGGNSWKSLRLNRNGWLAINAVVLTSVLVFVVAGSVYPAFRAVFLNETVIVNPEFYVTAILPLAVIIAVSLVTSVERRIGVLAAATVGGLAIGWLAYGPGLGLALFAPAVAAVAVLGVGLALHRRRGRQLGLRLAHLGMAIVLFGVAGSSFGDEFEGPMRPGDSVEVGGQFVTLQSIGTGEADRFIFVEAEVDVDGTTLTPQIRAYEDQTLPIAEPALASGPAVDVIVAVSLLFPDTETVDVSVFVRPLVWWVWIGSVVILLGGLVVLVSKDEVVSVQRRSATAVQRSAGTTTDTDVR